MDVNLQVSARFASFVQDWDYETYLLLGGYGSGKSYAVVEKIVLKLLEEKRTCLCCRNVYETIRESCYSLFVEVLTKMDMFQDGGKSATKVVGVVSPMQLRFPNGSRVIFKGLDDAEKVKSINGISIVWIEECSEIKYATYLELLGRIRTPDVSLHFILSSNPVGIENWIYKHFFVRTDENGKDIIIQDPNEFYRKRTIVKGETYYHHSVLDDNPFLPRRYKDRIDTLRFVDRNLWIVARWGRFGVNGNRVLPNFVIAKNPKEFKSTVRNISARYHFFGIDFGFEESYNALVSCCVDESENALYIYDEVYRNNVTDDIFAKSERVQMVKQRAENCDKPIYADSAEPKTIKFYRQQGFNMAKCKKYAGSRLQNTKKLKRFKKIVCSPKCKNAIRELQNLTYAKDSKGNLIYDEFNIDAHLFSALWYALDKYEVEDLKDYKNNTKAG